jgi:hypothetical protein
MASKTKRQEFTPEQKKEYREAQAKLGAEFMASAVADLLTSEGWRRWAACRAKMGHYSLNNQLMIFIQCPEATMVTKLSAWNQMGRGVEKGTHGLKIWAPLLRWPTSEEVADGHPKDKKVLYGWKIVSVFDVSQTKGDPLPIPESRPVSGDSHAEFLPSLLRFAKTLGFAVATEKLPAGTGGYCDPHAKRIVLGEGADANASVRVLIHELAHALGVGYQDYGREAAEVIVETVTFIVCSGIGLDTSGDSVPYVAGWGEQDSAEAIKKFAGVVHTIARKIEDAIEEAS